MIIDAPTIVAMLCEHAAGGQLHAQRFAESLASTIERRRLSQRDQRSYVTAVPRSQLTKPVSVASLLDKRSTDTESLVSRMADVLPHAGSDEPVRDVVINARRKAAAFELTRWVR